MPFKFSEGNCAILSVADYLRANSKRGQWFQEPASGLVFYNMSDCICTGVNSQCILPVQSSGVLPFIFNESCTYLSNEHCMPGVASEGLQCNEVREIERAAPLYPLGADNLWHWTCESLPKLLALEGAGYDGPYIVPANSQIVGQSLEMFGISPERILFSGPVYHIKKLILPQRLNGFALADDMKLTAFLRSGLMRAVCGPDTDFDFSSNAKKQKRCYVRRIGSRKIINEPEVLSLLGEYDFEVMSPEYLSQKDQWRYMVDAECSVMAHGANSTLCLLQPKGSGMVELFGNRYVSYNNLHAVRLQRLRYHALVEDLEPSSSVNGAYGDLRGQNVYQYLLDGMRTDLEADILHLRILLENMLGSKN